MLPCVVGRVDSNGVRFGDVVDEGKYPCRVGGVWKNSIGVNDNSFVGEVVVVRFSKY